MRVAIAANSRCAIRATISTMEALDVRLVDESRQVLARSRESCRLARNRISRSRRQISHSEDVVVATASAIGAARSALKQTPGGELVR